MLATDFLVQLEAMKERGEVDNGQVLNGGFPRELKRGWLALVDKLGHGAFGDVSIGMASSRSVATWACRSAWWPARL